VDGVNLCIRHRRGDAACNSEGTFCLGREIDPDDHDETTRLILHGTAPLRSRADPDSFSALLLRASTSSEVVGRWSTELQE
jgi:hypothetical protein